MIVHRNIGKHSAACDTEKTASLIPMPVSRRKSVSAQGASNTTTKKVRPQNKKCLL